MFEKLESFLKTGSFPPPPAFCQSKEALSFYGFTDGTQPEEPGAALLYAADDCLVTCGVLSDRDLYNLKGSRFAIVRQNYTHGRKNPEITSTQVFPRTAHTPYLIKLSKVGGMHIFSKNIKILSVAKSKKLVFLHLL